MKSFRTSSKKSPAKKLAKKKANTPLKNQRKKLPAGKPREFLEGEFKLPELEERVLAFWDERGIFEKSLVRDPRRKFVFYEGPPYANGKPAIHHVISRITKDIILRYKTMQGYYVPRRAGWDTHGLPVEMAAEKALGFKSKRDIEAFGVQKFNEEAKKQVWLYEEEWQRMTRRIGYWLDLKNAYVTYAPEYIETIWWTLAEIHKKGLLYKGHRIVPWCTRCGTALSSHELAQGYKDVTDRSVFVKFKVKPGQRIGNVPVDDHTYILSWTTTPWTLPGNVALAVGEKIDYVMTSQNGEHLILAKERMGVLRSEGVEQPSINHAFPGKDLVGLEYKPLFESAALASPNSYKVYPASFVTTTDGTGVVHTAVMYGEDDYALGKKVGLPEHHTVSEEGKFTNDVTALAGRYVKSKETEDAIFEHLTSRGALLRVEEYTHEYPFCWRCGTPILYYARTSWFIAMSKLRNELLARNATVSWTPDHVKAGRFGEWLREAKDWNLSRERYWGATLPIWECKSCNHLEVVSGLDDLDRRTGGGRNHYWALRHGESDNVVRRVIDSGNGNSRLTARGRREVANAAKALKKKDIDLIVASDILRTKETAEIVAKELGVPVHFDGRLREINLAGLSGKPITEYWNILPTVESRLTGRPVEGSESYADVRTRAWEFLRELEKKHDHKNILIVSHEDVVWMLAQAALGWSNKKAIEEKGTGTGNFLAPAGVKEFVVKTVPRDDTGLVDLHRPFADHITIPCSKCHAEMKRVPEVADVWYDSGAMPYAQAHYPFAFPKTNLRTLSGLDYPADYIAEGMDQTRGWFYTLLAIATALGYKAPYKKVVVLGLINDKFGQKMSKSKGNVVEPFSIIDKYGVDALRWYFFTSSPLSETMNFDEGEIAKAFRKTHLIAYNSFVFWKTYADRSANVPTSPKNVLDQWILARLAETELSVTKKLDRYEIREAALEIDQLVDDLSRWYIRRSRRRLQKPEHTGDYKAASGTLRHVLFTLIRMMAPFTPFFSEIFYAPLGGTKESVHLDAWPTAGKAAVKKPVIDSMTMVRELAALGLAERAEKAIKVRQPLAKATAAMPFKKLTAPYLDILQDEINVKAIEFGKLSEGKSLELDTVITPELRAEGVLRELVRMVQELRQRAGLSPKDSIAVMLELKEEVRSIVMKDEMVFKKEVGARLVEYRRSEKFQAEESAKIDGQEAWVAIRKL